MKLKDKLRLLAFKILGQKNINLLRYLKFSYKFSRFAKIKDKSIFAKEFSKSYESEMQIIPKIISNPKTIIDIGANYGTYSFFLSKLYPQAKIFAFEPATGSYNILKKIIRRFNLNNVIPIKKGLGSKEETKEIITPMHYTIIAYIGNKNMQKNKEDDSEEIEITTLDNFVKKNKIQRIDFIKCDVEGFELSVFKGAKKTLRKFKPVVFVEIEERHTKKYKINPQDVLDFFKNIGYKSYSVKKDKIERADKVIPEIPLYIFSIKKIT